MSEPSGSDADRDAASLGRTLAANGRTVLIGTCSWTDKTLTESGDWYPRRSMRAEDRLRFYAEHFPIVEVDATYYWPPTIEQSILWAERTPDHFVFDVKAYSLLTGHATDTKSLWPEIRATAAQSLSGKARVYAHTLAPDALAESWRRFGEALEPLHAAGKLGAVLFQYPPWFRPNHDARTELRELRRRLPRYRICVEFRAPQWLADERDRVRTLELLRHEELALVCVDAPPVSGLPHVFEATSADLAVVRFHGRADDAWATPSKSAAERFRYLYSDEELETLASQVAPLCREARETHLLMNNCYRDYGVRNAATLRDFVEPRLHDD